MPLLASEDLEALHERQTSVHHHGQLSCEHRQAQGWDAIATLDHGITSTVRDKPIDRPRCRSCCYSSSRTGDAASAADAVIRPSAHNRANDWLNVCVPSPSCPACIAE